MIDDIQATFMHRFIATSRTRVATALAAATAADHAALSASVRELHSVAGEAGLLGVPEIVDLARTGENRAREMFAERTEAAATAAIAALRALEQALERLAQR